MKTQRQVLNLLFALFAGMTVAPRAAADEISSLASVQADGSLKVADHLVRLYGIYIPPTDPKLLNLHSTRAVRHQGVIGAGLQNFGRFCSLRAPGDISRRRYQRQLPGWQ